MTEQAQIYKGRFPDQKPTESQFAMLRKMNVKESVIRTLTRESAFRLIREIWTRYYEEKVQRRFNGKIVVKW